MFLKKVLDTFLPGTNPESALSVTPQQPESDPTYEERAAEQRRILVEALQQHSAAFRAFNRQVTQETPDQSWGYADAYKRVIAEQPILKDIPQARIGMIIALTYWLTEKTKSLDDVKLIDKPQYSRASKYLVTRLFDHKLPYTPADLTLVLNLLARHTKWQDTFYLHYYPVATMLKRVEELVKSSGLTPDMERALKRFREIITRKNNEHRRIRLRIQALLGETVLTNLEKGLPWVDSMKEDIQAMEVAKRQLWESLVEHSLSPRSTKPSQMWLDKAREIVDAIGEEAFKPHLLRWFSLIEPGTGTLIPANAEDVLRGLVWACLLIDDNNLAHVIGELALIFLAKVRGHGPLSLKAGYACLYTLSRMASDGAVGELCRIRTRVKLADVRRKVAIAMDEAASRRGLTPSALEEIAVPSFGWDSERCYPDRPGGYRAKFAYRPGGRIRVDWYNPNGKHLKSTPSIVRTEHAKTLQRIRQIQKTANALFATQRVRIERLFIEERTWPLADWRAHYNDHPFVSLLSHLLIWRFEQGEQRADAVWFDGQMIDLHGRPLEWLTDDTQVSLWHPLECEAETVLAWRAFLEERCITQPFKQAHREIYILTDAEITTSTYSNRFAAHILRHVPFFGVIRRQGWKYSTSYGHWNNYRTPTLEVPHANLRVQYWIDLIHDPAVGEGVHQCISTDQVRFIDENGEPMQLAQVPPRVFSEAMRDIDIFVGATSIGNDPRWQDQGERPVAMRNYWQSYSFGELSTTAANRRELLERLLPKLKIADCARLTEKFLVVEGQIRTYKIHLGSGNILMKPNDQYLCIVPSRSHSPPNLFLPFEGDSTLAVILSKAFLLADDRQISDPTIKRQIKQPR